MRLLRTECQPAPPSISLPLVRYPLYKYVLALADYLVLVGVFLVALKTRHGALDVFTTSGGIVDPTYLAFVVYAILVLFLFKQNNLYKTHIFLSVGPQIRALGKCIVISLIGLATLSYFTKSTAITESRFVLLYFGIGSWVLLSVVRVVVIRSAFIFLSDRGLYRRTTVIIGAGKRGKFVAAQLGVAKAFAVKVIGFIDDGFEEGTIVFQGLKVLGRVDDLPRLVEEHNLREVTICVGDVSRESLLDIVDQCRKLDVQTKIHSDLLAIVGQYVDLERYSDLPFIDATEKVPGRFHSIYGRVFDVIAVSVGIVLLAPVYVILAIAIKLTSPGPAIYRQERIGKNGRSFGLYKFRTMYNGSDQDRWREEAARQAIRKGARMAEGSTKVVNKSNITPVGGWLRRKSLDELPQLFNVIKGDMTLVGPRPCLPYEWEIYDKWHKRRLSVKPGCTGLWQVSGRSEVGFDDMVILDIYYIHNRSPLLDLRLVARTIPTMVFGRGAG